jgi:CheY-like chemotaxis protein/Tfp pilus assembly protein PilZ
VAYTQDLSRGGMFLRTQRFLPLNAVIRLFLELPEDGGEVSAIARVVYVRDEGEARASRKPAGMGIQFLDLAGESAGRIERFIAERTTLESEHSAPQRVNRRLSVLVVDDDDNYRELAASPFRDRQDSVRTAGDGLQGLAACLKDPPDVILSDVQMPRMDGWQLLRMVRVRPSLSSIPVVFLTTLSGDEERLKGYQLGVDDYVAKPYRPEELIVRVDRLVGRLDSQGSKPNVGRKTLRGDLEQVALPSVLSFLEVERKTGVLLLVGERTARIYLRDGRPLRVELADEPPDTDSKRVIYGVLGWTTGQFEFALQDVMCDDELQVSVTALLLEHARLGDEARR